MGHHSGLPLRKAAVVAALLCISSLPGGAAFLPPRVKTRHFLSSSMRHSTNSDASSSSITDGSTTGAEEVGADKWIKDGLDVFSRDDGGVAARSADLVDVGLDVDAGQVRGPTAVVVYDTTLRGASRE